MGLFGKLFGGGSSDGKYKVTLRFPDGERSELDERFSSYEDAERAALEAVSDYHAGGEYMDPLNYDASEDEVDYDIEEV